MELLKMIGGFIVEILKQIAKLIDVKSIVTLTLTATMVIAILGKFAIEDNMFNLFSNAVMLVLGFFFAKKQASDENK
jgi:Na+-translocating ferredoxin:NAD+ oxidoreductase RnfD subunit